MYEIFTGFKPYEDMIEKGITAKELIKAVTEDNLRPMVPPANPDGTMGRLNLQVPSEFLDLMTECWHKNPARRPSIKEIEERILEVIEDKNLARTTNTMGKQQQALAESDLHVVAGSRDGDAHGDGGVGWQRHGAMCGSAS